MFLHERVAAEQRTETNSIPSASPVPASYRRRTMTIGSQSWALAIGAFAVGALAVGALAIGRLAVGRARVRRLEIDELIVHTLQVTDMRVPDTLQVPAIPGTEA
jgi:hypothetical protein